MWTLGPNTQPAKTRTNSGTSRYRLLGALLVLSALGAGLFGLGHDHAEDLLSDEDHCAVCAAHHSTLLTDTITKFTFLVSPWSESSLGEWILTRSDAYRLGPPRRGPPSA